ncbi:ABC transporter ATP-binding protein [Micrococcus sp. IITD107]|uniref:ABC transporter ATP-binding protein n=1 Tax=Micrococcus sp. IITD107 TaxID=3342790 RepID=UPI0035B8253D
MTETATTPQTTHEPVVVLDNVSMEYKVTSSHGEQHRKLPWFKRLLYSVVRRDPTVTVRALQPLSLVVHQGESVGIVGRNGSGKSTLSKLICGQIRPTSGTVRARTTPIMLGVNAALVQALSGDQNIQLGCLAMGMTPEQVEEKFDSIVELSGLGKSVYLPLKSYSSGMSSRLRFAIACAVDPEILVIDEALNTGDAQFKGRTKARMDELRAQAGCVFLVSHSMSTLKSMCSRVVWIDKGELIADGPAKEVIAQYQSFTEELSKGRNSAAMKIRDEVRSRLQQVSINYV